MMVSSNLVGALAGDRSSAGKAKGGGLRIAATIFIHKYVIFLQRIVVRQGRTNKKRPDNVIPAATNGDDPSWICPPDGRRGNMERGDCMMLPLRTIAADSRHAQNVLSRSDASDYFSNKLCPLPGAMASRKILPTFPPHKCPGGHDKDDDG